MVVQTITTNGCPQTIVIGRRGTYDTLQIAFDLGYLVESYGSGVAVLAVKRSQDESAYPAVTTQADNTLTWTVSETDTAYVGAGECQLMWYVDGGLAKTIIYPMVVMRDILSTAEEAPDAYQTWVDDLTALGAETLQNAQDAAQSASDAESAKDDAVAAKEAAEAALEEFTTPTASATTLAAGSQATAEYSDGNFAFGIPRGADGSPGTPGAPGADGVTPDFSIGTVTTLEPTQPATATITGTPEAPVLNLGIPKGAKGDPGQGGGSVDSVNGQTGDVVLDAGDLEFDDSETYAAGSIGAEVSNQKNAISQNEDAIADTQSMIATVEATATASKNYAVGDLLVYGGKLYKVTSAIATGATIIVGSNVTQTTVEDQLGSGGAVDDVQINGTSIVDANGVANIPNASSDGPGVVRINADRGITLYGTNSLQINAATSGQVKNGGTGMLPLTPYHQHEATFYGLAKAAGDSTQSASSNPVGTYTEDAKSAIHGMLNGAVAVSGTTPSITAKSGITYVCGEVATLDITIPASGIFEVQFVSGSTPTVLTATGVSWVGGFDPTALEANKTYDISVSNGIGVAVWT